ncbi:hypothetical protein LNI88_11320 [Tenacibaculum dicentrarchi]|nr:hypothetical protein [Tenacibaculum dicentrarchi]
MEKKFIESNIVLLGNFKPTVFDKLFFIKNNLISEEDFSESSVFTPKFSRIESSDLIIIIESNKIVLVSRTNKSDLLKSISLNIINENSTSLNIIGFNFKWFILLEEIPKYTKSKFFSPTNESLNNHFNDDNTAYGYYISSDFKNSRMKLDIKPNILKEINNDKEQNILSFDFNFHIEIEDNSIFNESLNDYISYVNKAEKIISEYE